MMPVISTSLSDRVIDRHVTDGGMAKDDRLQHNPAKTELLNLHTVDSKPSPVVSLDPFLISSSFIYEQVAIESTTVKILIATNC